MNSLWKFSFHLFAITLRHVVSIIFLVSLVHCETQRVNVDQIRVNSPFGEKEENQPIARVTPRYLNFHK